MGTVKFRDPIRLARMVVDLRRESQVAQQRVDDYLPGIIAGTIKGSRERRRRVWGQRDVAQERVEGFMGSLSPDEREALNVYFGTREFTTCAQ